MSFLPKKNGQKEQIMTFVNLINQNIRQLKFDMFKLTIGFKTNGLFVSFLLVILVGWLGQLSFWLSKMAIKMNGNMNKLNIHVILIIGASNKIDQSFNQNEQNIQVGHLEKLVIIAMLYNMQTWLTFVIIINPCTCKQKCLVGLIWAINAQAMVEILKPFMEQCVLN